MQFRAYIIIFMALKKKILLPFKTPSPDKESSGTEEFRFVNQNKAGMGIEVGVRS